MSLDDLFDGLDSPNLVAALLDETKLPQIKELLNDAERHFGKGESYNRQDREAILEGVIPEWLLRGRKLLKGPDQQRCEKAIEHLKGLHAAVWPRVKFGGE